MACAGDGNECISQQTTRVCLFSVRDTNLSMFANSKKACSLGAAAAAMWKVSAVSVATVLQVFLPWLPGSDLGSWLLAPGYWLWLSKHSSGWPLVLVSLRSDISSMFTVPKSSPFDFRFHSIQSSGPLSFGIFESLFKELGMVILNILRGKMHWQ